MLSNRRGFSQLALPVTLEAIAAFEASFGHLTIWEKRVLCRLDDAVLAVINGRALKKAKRTKDEEQKPSGIPMSDAAGVRAFMQSLKSTKKGKTAHG